MNLQQLPYLPAIAREGSLSAAARALGVTQPALSRYLHDRERDAGIPLFYRERKKMYPTQAGKIYLEAIQEIQEVWDNTRRAIALLDSKPTEHVRIGLSPHRGSTLLASIYPQFNREFPQVEMIALDGYFQEDKERLLQGKIDIILSGGEESPELDSIPVVWEEIVLAIPAYHRPGEQPAEQFQDLSYAELEDFRDQVFIMPRGGTALTKVIRPLFQRAGFQPQVAFSASNVLMEYRLIAAGMGVGLLPAFYADPRSGMLFYRFKDPIYMVSKFFTRPGHKFTRAERFMIYLMVKGMYQEAACIQRTEFRWCDFTRELVEEWDPTWAQELRREDPDYGQ